MEGSKLDPVEEADAIASQEASGASPEKAGFAVALRREVRSHPFGYGVMAVGIVLGPVILRMIFPEITVLQAIVGGLAFGVYAALSAVPQKFM